MKVNSYGRLVYVEPNDFVNDTFPLDNVTWDPEDLNMSVDLQVIVPRRSDFGQTELTDGSRIITEVNWSDNSEIGKFISFMQGADIVGKYMDNMDGCAIKEGVKGHELTTDYINATYSELYRDGKSSKESLGIESIDITFDQHFYPQVNIKFIDVRGYSLMMPAEEEYLATQEAKQGKNTERTEQLANGGYSNFFRALFHFPYPKFLLTIKGFYGTSITFTLAVNEFRNNFNSTTGNFEINVSFIGYMYGLYTDLPLNFLITSPYYGSDTNDLKYSSYWASNSKSKHAFDDGNGNKGKAMLTFVDFIENCGKLNEARKKIDQGTSEYKTLEERGKMNDKIESLNKVVTALNKFADRTRDVNKDFKVKITPDNNIDSVWYDTSTGEEDTMTAKIPTKDWNEFVNAWNDASGNTEIGFPKWLSPDLYNKDANEWKKLDDGNETLEVSFYKPFFKEDGNDSNGAPKYVPNPDSNGGIKYSQIKDDKPDFAKMIESKPYIDYPTNNVFYIFPSFIKDKINEKIGTLNLDKASSTSRSMEEMKSLYESNLGFVPFILNIYRMIFAHVDCFMSEFYDLLTNIRKLGSKREFSNFGLTIDNTDLNKKTAGSAIVPPFPGIYRMSSSGIREQIYPGEIDGMTEKMPEIAFIENFINGAMGLKKKVNEILINQKENSDYNSESETANNKNSGNYEYNPTSLTDFKSKKNPYTAIDANLGRLMYFFMLRYASSYYQLYNTYSGDTSESRVFNIGSLEANNFIAIHKTIPTAMKNELKSAFDSRDNGHAYMEAMEKFINENKNSIAITAKIDDSKTTLNVGGMPVYFTTTAKNAGDTVKTNDDGTLPKNSDKTFDIMDGNSLSGDTDNFRAKTSTYHESIQERLKGATETEMQAKNELPNQLLLPRANGDEKASTWFIYSAQTINGQDGLAFTRWVDCHFDEDQCLTHFLVTLAYGIYSYQDTRELDKKSCMINIGFTNSGLDNSSIQSRVDRLSYVTILLLGCILKNGEKDWYGYSGEDGWILRLNPTAGTPRYYLGKDIYDKAYKSIKENEDIKNRIIEVYDNYLKSAEWAELKKMLSSKSYYKQNTDIQHKPYYLGDDLRKKINDTLISNSKDLLIYNIDGEFIIKHNEENGDKSLKLNNSEFKVFIETLWDYYKDKDTLGEQYKSDFTKSDVTTAYRLALYNSLKNLYDKWANSYRRESFELRDPSVDRNVKRDRFQYGNTYGSTEIKEFDNFIFVDCFYNDISYKFKINPTTVKEMLERQVNSESNFSIYEFMAEIMQKNRMLFQALPVYNNYYNISTIEKIFSPNIHETMKMGLGSTYMGMYTYEVSHVIGDDNGHDHLQDDSFNMVDDLNGITDDPNPVTKTFFANNSANGIAINVPAFGVTYARQNQSYFKNIDVNMDNPRITDYSIANLFQLMAPKKANELEQPHTVANDIYSIYANRSYNCSIDMMGCANIMPMMYFQLNNIPMFRGAYMISNVEHHIKAGDFTTRFSGVRISKNQLPYNDNLFNIDNALDYRSGGSYGLTEGVVGNVSCGEFDPNASVALMDKLISCGTKSINGPKNTTKSNGACACCVRQFIEAGLRSANNEQAMAVYRTLSIDDHDGSGSHFPNGIQWHHRPTDSTHPYPLKALGFELIKTIPGGTSKADINGIAASIPCIKGDVAVMYHDDHPYSSERSGAGHICMFTGSSWVSDFRQNNLYVYSEVAAREVYIYRYKGCKAEAKASTNPNPNAPTDCVADTYARETGKKPSYPYRIFNITRSNDWDVWNDVGITSFNSLNTARMSSNSIKACRRFTTHSDAKSACCLFIRYIKKLYFDKGRNTPESIIMKYCPPSENGDKHVCIYIESVSAYLTKRLGTTITRNTNLTFNKDTVIALGEIMARIEQATNVVEYMPEAWASYEANPS